MDRRSLGEIAIVTFLARQGDDLAAELEGRASACRRHRNVTNPFGALDPAGAEFDEIGGNLQLETRRGLSRGVIHVQVTGLFIDNAFAPGRCLEDREILVLRQPPDRARGAAVSVEVELTVAVGPEIELIAQPAGVGIIAARTGLGDGFDFMGFDIEQEDPRDGPATVMLPLAERLAERDIGDGSAIGGDGCFAGVGNGQARGKPAIDRDRKKLSVTSGVDFAAGSEQYRVAVRGEAQGGVISGVIGESAREATLGRDEVDVGIALVTAGEG